jgi:nonribosomal peptide synthetase protein BlmVI
MDRQPASPVDLVAQAWAAALGRPDIDPDAGFFDLGADSATVMEVVRTLRARWPGLKVVDVFANPSVRSLAAHLEEASP